jgi:cytoskeleton protein RodZ
MSAENTDPRMEPGIGPTLERARQSKGLSLREVEQRTRIRSRYLRDLEREEFDVLPAVYVLGSLKTYADFLGLDGADLSRRLKARLTEPDEPDEQEVAPGTAQEDEFEAAPVPAVGFDQLFLGIGVILISILAIMTLVAAVAGDDGSPVSQVDEPSTPELSSGLALAGNTQEGGGDPENAGGVTVSGGSAPDEEEKPKEGPEASKDGGGDASRSNSIFGDVEFVPMQPSSPGPSSTATAASASAAPASAAPGAARPEERPSAPSSATVDASARPPGDGPGDAPSAPPSNAGVPAPGPAGPESAGRPSPPTSRPTSAPIPVEAARMMDEAARLTGSD